MIKEIQENTGESVRTMAKGKELVAEGVSLATRASQALESIVAASDKGAAMVDLIATAAEEQASVAYEVSSGVERMAELSKSADGDSSTVGAAATDLSRIADDLNRKASWFGGQG